jgi:hypothetical protein
MLPFLVIALWNLPFDQTQGGELVEPFGFWVLKFEITESGSKC